MCERMHLCRTIFPSFSNYISIHKWIVMYIELGSVAATANSIEKLIDLHLFLCARIEVNWVQTYRLSLFGIVKAIASKVPNIFIDCIGEYRLHRILVWVRFYRSVCHFFVELIGTSPSINCSNCSITVWNTYLPAAPILSLSLLFFWVGFDLHTLLHSCSTVDFLLISVKTMQKAINSNLSSTVPC